VYVSSVGLGAPPATLARLAQRAVAAAPTRAPVLAARSMALQRVAAKALPRVAAASVIGPGPRRVVVPQALGPATRVGRIMAPVVARAMPVVRELAKLPPAVSFPQLRGPKITAKLRQVAAARAALETQAPGVLERIRGQAVKRPILGTLLGKLTSAAPGTAAIVAPPAPEVLAPAPAPEVLAPAVEPEPGALPELEPAAAAEAPTGPGAEPETKAAGVVPAGGNWLWLALIVGGLVLLSGAGGD